MEITIQISSISSTSSPLASSSLLKIPRFQLKRREPKIKIRAISHNGSASHYNSNQIQSSLLGDEQRIKQNLESLFCYDKPVPEEIIETPIGLSMGERKIGDNPRCIDCQAKGAVLCATCSGSGLYIDSILESQGIMVKVVEALATSCVQDVAVEVILELNNFMVASFI
eukprot:TRINITY_DN2320_c0_g1_i1.p1 TRINITY_DN2320_c0_g1~~TRINITY_DN2320_c0_g1_i1.p1  ORF type:complete len:169 (+),score=19.61 TRINITY_DN2320_c0_g1_i1:135-641(+)